MTDADRPRVDPLLEFREVVNAALDGVVMTSGGGLFNETRRRAVDQLLERYAALQGERNELEKMVYIGDHHFPDLTWKVRAEELATALRKAEALGATWRQQGEALAAKWLAQAVFLDASDIDENRIGRLLRRRHAAELQALLAGDPGGPRPPDVETP